MKTRFLACLLVLSLSAPAMARPSRIATPRTLSSLTRAWHSFINAFSGFRLLTNDHTFPPPSTSTVLSPG